MLIKPQRGWSYIYVSKYYKTLDGECLRRGKTQACCHMKSHHWWRSPFLLPYLILLTITVIDSPIKTFLHISAPRFSLFSYTTTWSIIFVRECKRTPKRCLFSRVPRGWYRWCFPHIFQTSSFSNRYSPPAIKRGVPEHLPNPRWFSQIEMTILWGISHCHVWPESSPIFPPAPLAFRQG